MKLSKVLLGSSLAISAVAIPSSLTSCSQAWGSLTPISIGGDTGDSPYSAVTILNYYDADGGDLRSYIQSNYAIHSAKSTSYAYSSPMKFVDHDEEQQQDTWELGSSGWYTSSDEALVSTATDKYKDGDKKVSRTVTNARNATLSGNIDFISTIGTTISSYLSNAWQYQASQIANDENLAIAWGSQAEGNFKKTLNHGTSDGKIDGQNNKFYESIFALANANGTGTSKALLRTSNVKFKFYKYSPIPGYKYEGEIKPENRRLHPDFINMLEHSEQIGDGAKYYTSVKKDIKDGDYTYDSYVYEAVPINIMFNKMSQTYVDPTKSADSFLINDYLSTDENINEAVGDHWKGEKGLNKYTGIGEDKAIPHFKTFTLDTENASKTIIKDNVKDLRFHADVPVIYGSDYIALMSYTVNVYKDHPEKNTAIMNSLQYVFPAYLIELYDDLYKQTDNGVDIFDIKKLDKVMKKFRELFEHTAGQGLVADVTKLNQESKNLLSFLGYTFGSGENVVNTNDVLFADWELNK